MGTGLQGVLGCGIGVCSIKIEKQTIAPLPAVSLQLSAESCTALKLKCVLAGGELSPSLLQGSARGADVKDAFNGPDALVVSAHSGWHSRRKQLQEQVRNSVPCPSRAALTRQSLRASSGTESCPSLLIK